MSNRFVHFKLAIQDDAAPYRIKEIWVNPNHVEAVYRDSSSDTCAFIDMASGETYRVDGSVSSTLAKLTGDA